MGVHVVQINFAKQQAWASTCAQPCTADQCAHVHARQLNQPLSQRACSLRCTQQRCAPRLLWGRAHASHGSVCLPAQRMCAAPAPRRSPRY